MIITPASAVKRCIVYCAAWAGLRPISDCDNCIFPVHEEINYLCIVKSAKLTRQNVQANEVYY